MLQENIYHELPHTICPIFRFQCYQIVIWWSGWIRSTFSEIGSFNKQSLTFQWRKILQIDCKFHELFMKKLGVQLGMKLNNLTVFPGCVSTVAWPLCVWDSISSKCTEKGHERNSYMFAQYAVTRVGTWPTLFTIWWWNTMIHRTEQWKFTSVTIVNIRATIKEPCAIT